MRALSFISGLVFSVGLCISGMVRPSKVTGFLDLYGDWDPSLLFVMVGALSVFRVAWWILDLRGAPMIGKTIPTPVKRGIDSRLIFGSALFGVGWGLGGFCPGPAIVSAPTMISAAVFLAAMIAGISLYRMAFEQPRTTAFDESPSCADG